MKVVVAAFNQEKALLGAFSVITNLRMKLFEALAFTLRSFSRLSTPAVRAVLTWHAHRRNCQTFYSLCLSLCWAVTRAGQSVLAASQEWEKRCFSPKMMKRAPFSLF